MTDLRLELDQAVPIDHLAGWKVAVIEACPKHQVMALIAVSPTVAQAIREKRLSVDGKRAQLRCLLQSAAKLLALFFRIPVSVRGQPPGVDPSAFTFTALPAPPSAPSDQAPTGPRLN